MNENISSELLELNQLYHQPCRNFALRFGLLPEQVKNLFGNICVFRQLQLFLCSG